MSFSTPSFGNLSNDNGAHQFDASSSSSPAGSNNATAAHSDEEIILASARPKKRAGRRIFQETRHPVYRGVRLRNKDKWVCEMRIPNDNKSRIWLGTYQTPEMAARAHDVAALTFRGKSACLNFADSAWRVRLPESTDAVEIRRAAIEAAEMLSGEPQQQSYYEYHNVSSAGVEDDGMVMENSNETVQQHGAMCDEQVAHTESGFDMYDFRMSFSDMPIMSRPPSPTNFINDHHCQDVEIFDTPVSLWNL